MNENEINGFEAAQIHLNIPYKDIPYLRSQLET
jgi:hypothetical protein